jgi:hypothetical protein
LIKNRSFYEVANNKSGKKFERIEVTKFEVAEEKDYIDFTYILASSVENGNGALTTEEELGSAEKSIIHQPLIIVPDWDDLPTGHSLEDFPKLGWDAMAIGSHISSEVFEDNGIHHLKTTARVWKIRYPEIASKMMSLYEAGQLKFSMEARFQSQTIEGATRTLHGLHFIGSAVVDDPANPFSYALEVAKKRKQKEDKAVNFEQAMKKLKELDADVYVLVSEEVSSLNKSVTDLTGDKEGLETSSKTMKESLETANNKITELNGTIDTMKQEKEKAELAQKQEARFKEIAEYINIPEGEVATKKEAYGKMDEDVWNIVLETAKLNKKETKSSNVEFATDTKLDITAPNGFLDGLGEEKK